MTYGMEFHDTYLLDMGVDSSGEGFVVFHASVYRSEGQVFKNAQESGWQNVRFFLKGMRVEGATVELGQYASGGDLWIEDCQLRNVISLPLEGAGRFRFELQLAPNFGTTTIHASHVRSQFEGEFELEALWDEAGNVTPV